MHSPMARLQLQTIRSKKYITIYTIRSNHTQGVVGWLISSIAYCAFVILQIVLVIILELPFMGLFRIRMISHWLNYAVAGLHSVMQPLIVYTIFQCENRICYLHTCNFWSHCLVLISPARLTKSVALFTLENVTLSVISRKRQGLSPISVGNFYRGKGL